MIDLYCERTDPGLWAEPVNAATNAAFLVSAWLIWRLARQRGQLDGSVRVLVGLAVAIAIGSGLFHIFRNINYEQTRSPANRTLRPLLCLAILSESSPDGVLFFGRLASCSPGGCLRWQTVPELAQRLSDLRAGIVSCHWLIRCHLRQGRREPYVSPCCGGCFCDRTIIPDDRQHDLSGFAAGNTLPVAPPQRSNTLPRTDPPCKLHRNSIAAAE